jgi:hypothetical protein
VDHGPYRTLAAHQPQASPLECPECRVFTPSLKAFTVVDFALFGGFLAGIKTGRVVACPACMRKALGIRTLANLLPGNLLWLLVVLPWHLVLLAATYREGHSRSVDRGSGELGTT